MVCINALSRLLNYDKGTLNNDNIIVLKAEHLRLMHQELAIINTSYLEEIRKMEHKINKAWERYKEQKGYELNDGLLRLYNHIYVPDRTTFRNEFLKKTMTQQKGQHGSKTPRDGLEGCKQPDTTLSGG